MISKVFPGILTPKYPNCWSAPATQRTRRSRFVRVCVRSGSSHASAGAPCAALSITSRCSESIFTSKEPTRNWKAGYGVQDGSSVAESTIKRGWQGKRMQLCNRPASTQGAVSCEGSVRGGRSESIWLLRRVDSISSVSRNHATGSSSLSFVVPNGP